MISLERHGRPLRIGHRGAATLAPENTLRSFRAAVETGVDLVEFDVTAGPGGALVVAHDVEDVGPDTPTLDDALRFFVEEAREVGVHIDLKLTGREREVLEALRRHDLVDRSFVSSVFLTTARRLGNPGVPVGITIPRQVLGISDEGRGAPIARIGLRCLRFTIPVFVRPLLAFTRARAVVIHHSIVTARAVRAAHARRAAVVTWTVDDPVELARVTEAGVDAVVTNDPRIFAPDVASTIPA